jgi:protein SCO1/2
MQNKSLLAGILAITALVVSTAVVMFSNVRPSFRNREITPSVPAVEISMTDDNGKPFQMSNLRGKVVLLYFGFVNCPDECPLTMAHFKQVLQMLGPASADVQVVMVSTDPLRDTPQALKDFLGHFDPGFIGIPGSLEQLTKIWNDYGVVVLDGGETHSSYTYVIDRSGKQRLNFLPDSAPEDMLHDLKILLAEK